MSYQAPSMGRATLRLSVLAGACAAALTGFAVDDAAAAFSARVQAGTLRIAGDDASDRLALRLQAGAPATLLVDVGADGSAEFRFDRETFAAIDVDAGGGGDEVLVDESAGAFADESVTLGGGGGDDVLRGGSGGDALLGGDGNDVVDGNGGDDTAALGGGDDRVLWDAGDGSDRVDDEAGDDVVAVNGSDAGDRFLAAQVPKGVQVLRGFVGAQTSFDAAGVERVAMTTRGGVDIVTVNDLGGTGVRSATVDLAGGDAVPDFVNLVGTGRAEDVTIGSVGKGGVAFTGLGSDVQVLNADESRDSVSFFAADGDDSVTGGVGIGGPERVLVDGGSGTDTMTYRGSQANDSIALDGDTGRVRATAAATTSHEAAVERFVVEGLDGADAISASAGLAGLAELTLDGGSGDDVLAGGDGDDILLGGLGNDTADGNGGSDDVRLGSGNDRAGWDAGDGSDRTTGELGTDVLAVNGSEIGDKFDFSANGPGVRVVRNDATTTNDLDDIERAAVSALGGTDVVIVNDLAGTDLKTVDADLGGGDGQRDVVLQRGSERPDRVAVTRSGAQVLSTGLAAQLRLTGTEPGRDELRVSTLGGDDTITIAPDVRNLITTFADLGEDEPL